MNELALKYGCNPNQKIAKVYMKDGRDLPFTVRNGRPGYINLLDAFNSWQLVKELKEATGLPAAASFKHVSPAGAAVATDLSETLRKIYFVDDLTLSPLASAYAAARGADRMSSYGDFAALSDVCDKETALLLQREVSDGVIAPGYTEEALEILKSKRKGSYLVLQIDSDYVPEVQETKQVFGVCFEQSRNNAKITKDLLAERPTKNKELPDKAALDLLVALITLKYTQSNSVCYVKDGKTIGVGAASSPASIARVSPAARRTSGGCASTRKSWRCPLRPAFAVRTGTTRLTSIFPRTRKMYWPTACGSSFSRNSLRRSRAKKKRPGFPSCRAYPWAATRSSPSGTILNGPAAAASSMWPKPAVPSGTTMSSRRRTSTAW